MFASISSLLASIAAPHRPGYALSSYLEPHFYPSENPQNTAPDTSDDSTSYLAVLNSLAAAKISERDVAEGFQTAAFDSVEGAVYVDRVVSVPASIYGVAALTRIDGSETNTITLGSNTLHTQGDTSYKISTTYMRTSLLNALGRVFNFNSEASRLMKREGDYLAGQKTYSSDTGPNVPAIVFGAFGAIAFSAICYKLLKYFCTRRPWKRYQRAHDAHDLRGTPMAHFYTPNNSQGLVAPRPAHTHRERDFERQSAASDYYAGFWDARSAIPTSPVKSDAVSQTSTMVQPAMGYQHLPARVPFRHATSFESYDYVYPNVFTPPGVRVHDGKVVTPPRVELHDRPK